MVASIEKVNFESLNEIAYNKILNALRSGTFKPGESLKTRTLANALGVSSTPVREALSKLIAQNALDVDPKNRAAIVPVITYELLDELYSIRKTLDAMVIKAAVQNITDEEIAKVNQLEKQLAELDKQQDSQDFIDKSEEFFLTIFQSARKPLLYQMLDNLWLRSGVILGCFSADRPAGFSIKQYRSDLAKALKNRDAKAAVKAMDNILIKTRDMVFSALETKLNQPG